MDYKWSIASIAKRRQWEPCQRCKGERELYIEAEGRKGSSDYMPSCWIDCWFCDDGFNQESKIGLKYRLNRRKKCLYLK